MQSPEDTVRAFQSAHHVWETNANSRCSTVDDLTALTMARREYQELIARFCVATVSPQGMSFGDDPMHDPNREPIESTEIDGQSAIVRTRHIGLYDFASDYEYHLVKNGKGWRITSILYVTGDGKYECL
jgi:hypothetical protein